MSGFPGSSIARVHLVPGFLVTEKACGFTRFKSDMPPGDGIRGDIRKRKKSVHGAAIR